MVKLIAIYKQPENKEEFDKYYYEVHAPITAKIPGLQKMVVTKILGTPMGTESEYYLLCEMYYESHDALKAAMRTDEGRASGKDVMKFAGNLVSLMIGEEVE